MSNASNQVWFQSCNTFSAKPQNLQCDASRPHCQRCGKYGILCPGYPAKGLVFRNDTSVVRERAEKKYERKRQSRRSEESPAMQIENAIPAFEDDPSTQAYKSTSRDRLSPGSGTSTLSSQPDEQALVEGAVAAYLSQWNHPHVWIWWSALDVSTVSASNSLPKGSFGLALKAVSLMAMAKRPKFHSHDLMRSARIEYGAALKALNRASHDPRQFTDDRVFMALILGATFEVTE